MPHSGAALESVIEHGAQQGALDYEEIAPTVEALVDSGDLTLVPRLHEALERFLDDGNFYGRDIIAGLLAGIAGVAALPALLLAADRDLGDDQDGLQSDIDGLLAEDPAAARRIVLDLVRADAPHRRRVGLLALGAVAEPGDAALLAEAAGHTDPEIRLMAVETVVDPARDDRAFGIVRAALHDADEHVATAAINRLAATGRPAAVAALAAATTHDDPRMRARTAYALGRLGDPSATPALLALLHDADRHVRDQARDALGGIGAPAAVDALLAEATGDDPYRRAQAAKALAKAADTDPRAAPHLTRLARDPDPTVRAATLSGLATVADGSSRWAGPVTELADDPDPAVRQRVAFVVGHLAPEEAETLLRRLAEDPVATVRQAAAGRLNRMAR
ncbi:hypothetical protein Val02_09030 [Virgisporangium aliadipatigenens]|uniref:HEAT repeat domain-containing protein n=1 Tax=Virgisporangium aliadipatigenens TaxID=741659 RepID=A0A8J3YGW1_9ACTN|nr:HEAT repeat domain-containing protein [Virgisporangium aliadipatigenens]GIJ44017.1 hypothetical protein Val02_09030 [Virgisporangium aliadipatigenens]